MPYVPNKEDNEIAKGNFHHLYCEVFNAIDKELNNDCIMEHFSMEKCLTLYQKLNYYQRDPRGNNPGGIHL